MFVGLFARPAYRQNFVLSYVTDCKWFHRCLVQVLSQVTGPRSFLGGTIVIGPRSFPGDTPSLARGYPIPSLAGQGTPQSGQDGGVPQSQPGGTPSQSGQDGVPLAMTGFSTPPPPSSQDRTAEQTLAMWQAVCLLHSTRKW